MLNKKSLLAALIAASGCVAAYAQAPRPEWHRWYLEASGGQSTTSNELVRNRESTIVNGADIHSDFDSKDSAWKFGAGFQFLPWLALEVNYADLGRVRLDTMSSGGGVPGAILIDRKVSGWGADAVFAAPLGPRFGIYGRAGAFRSHLDTSAQLSGNMVFTNGDSTQTHRSVTQDETVGRLGAGLSWNAWRGGGLHVEYERYFGIGKAFRVGGSGTTGEADIDVWWLGIHQSF